VEHEERVIWYLASEGTAIVWIALAVALSALMLRQVKAIESAIEIVLVIYGQQPQVQQVKAMGIEAQVPLHQPSWQHEHL